MPKSQQASLFIAFVCAVISCIILRESLFALTFRDAPTLYMLGLFAIALSASHFRYSKTDRANKILLGSVAMLLGLYAAMNTHGYLIPDDSLEHSLQVARFLALLGGVLALFRPSFSLLPIIYTVWRKGTDIYFTGVYVSPTDYMPVVEVGLILVTFYIFAGVIGLSPVCKKIDVQKLLFWGLLTAIGAHFGNYFHSGIAKLLLNGGPLSWILENKTHYIALASAQMGLLPLAHWPDLTAIAYETFEQLYVANNVLVFIAQIACVAFITNAKRIIAITVFFDLMHVAIFVLTGIFFWKWIFLNIAIVSCMATLRHQKFSRNDKLIGAGFTVFGIFIFYTAQLAWYDTKSLKHTRILAIAEDDRTYEVPTNYFLNASLTFTQGRLLPAWPGHFEHANSLGSTADYPTMNRLNQCTPTLISNDQPMRFDRMFIHLKKHHEYVLDNINSNGLFYYDLFPHHVWSNPLLYNDFFGLDKRTIKAYKIIVESNCLTYENGDIGTVTISRTSSPELVVK